MTTRTLKATVPATAAEVIERLADPTAFPAHAEDVLSVTPVSAADGGEEHAWVLAFRGGSARWTQRTERVQNTDTDGPSSYRIAFEQTDGDFQRLKGAWTGTDLPDGGSEVSFEVDYATSVPHLAGAIDSAVGHVLLRSAHQVVSAVAGPARVTDGGYFLADLTTGDLFRQP